MKHRQQSEHEKIFWIPQVVWWGVGLWDTLYTWPITLPTDLQTIDDDVRNQENRILMWKCSSCLIEITSFINGTASKNGVLGGDKQVYYDNME